jgi:DNA repair protein RecO (recombination protein O)
VNRGARIDRQPAFVLHRRAYRESSLLLDLLTRDHGRIGAVARAARGNGRSSAGSLQPFQPLLVSWSGRGELKTLTGVERGGAAAPIAGERLFSALYVNELLVRALAPHDVHATLFDAYACLLPALAVAADAEPLLRAFELGLLRELGYALDFAGDAERGEVLEPAAMYAWEPGLGFLAAPGAPETHAYPGWSLAAIGRGDFSDPQTRRFAKRLLREALAPVTGERPLRSREYFRRSRIPVS